MKLEARFSKLRQRLKAWGDAFEKLPPRQRLLAMGMAGVMAVLLAYAIIIAPLLSLRENWAQELADKSALLHRYQSLAKEKGAVNSSYQSLEQALARADARMLTGHTPTVASAEIQEILKNLTKTLGIQVNSTNMLASQDSGSYITVPVEVQMVCSMEQLVLLLHRLENNEKTLVITEFDINALSRKRDLREPTNLRVRLVVAGLIKKGTAS